MTTDLDTGKITQLLTLSTKQLDARTLSALSNARQKALERQAECAPAFAFNAGGEAHNQRQESIQYWVVAGLLAAMLIAGTSFWQHIQEHQTAELDVAILTDDLPIEVFVD
ncbi:MAG: DUF3619 family protein [Nitrosomonadales bacterium]|nr:DUF3619 family protein [Nitrosomonadales bacterium]